MFQIMVMNITFWGVHIKQIYIYKVVIEQQSAGQ